jgi:hypothetical protein
MGIQWLGQAPENPANMLGQSIAQGAQNFAQGRQFNQQMEQEKSRAAQQQSQLTASLSQEKEQFDKVQALRDKADKREAEQHALVQLNNLFKGMKYEDLKKIDVSSLKDVVPPETPKNGLEFVYSKALREAEEAEKESTLRDETLNVSKERNRLEDQRQQQSERMTKEQNALEMAMKGFSVRKAGGLEAGEEPFATLPGATEEETRYVVQSPLAVEAENASLRKQKWLEDTYVISAKIKARTAALLGIVGSSAAAEKARADINTELGKLYSEYQQLERSEPKETEGSGYDSLWGGK